MWWPLARIHGKEREKKKKKKDSPTGSWKDSPALMIYVNKPPQELWTKPRDVKNDNDPCATRRLRMET